MEFGWPERGRDRRGTHPMDVTRGVDPIMFWIELGTAQRLPEGTPRLRQWID